jgi:hypothetical protein
VVSLDRNLLNLILTFLLDFSFSLLFLLLFCGAIQVVFSNLSKGCGTVDKKNTRNLQVRLETPVA